MEAGQVIHKGDMVWVHMTMSMNIANPCTITYEPEEDDQTWNVVDRNGTRFTINPFSSAFMGFEDWSKPSDAIKEANDGT